ncbi:hypothetical protein BC833DRAFT_574563 [Globomyces pollinis-pini]|nr:hypothetical protein BC833DRAFT_574563 [Globomyces pollinis-pini]
MRRHYLHQKTTPVTDTPKPKNYQKNKATILNDYNKLKAEIAIIKQTIEITEKKYKEHANIRKKLEANINGGKLALRDPPTVDELINMSKDDLHTVKNREQIKNEDQTRIEQTISESLAKRIAETKNFYKRKRSLNSAGPQFILHAYSPFGNILMCHPLTDNSIAVITNRNSLEIWATQIVNGERVTIVSEAFEIPGAPFSNALFLYTQDTEKEVDYLKLIPDNQNYLFGIKEQGDPKLTRLSSILKKEEATKSNERPPIGQRNNNAFTMNKSRFPSRKRRVIRVENLYHTILEKLNVSPDTEIDWKNYSLNDAPQLRYRTVFFVSYEDGQAGILELVWVFDPRKDVLSTACQVRVQKQISYQPIKLSYFYYLSDNTPIIVCETVTKFGEHLMTGLTLDLEPEWVCKCDMIRLSMSDRCTRYVNRVSLMQNDKKETQRVTEDYLITSYGFDFDHACLILSTTAGVLLRFFYQRDSKPFNAADVEDESGTNQIPIDPNEKQSLAGKLMWCLELSPILQETADKNEDDKAEEMLSAPERSVTLSKPIKITSIWEMSHLSLSHSQMLVGTNDGVIRIYPNDNLKCTNNPLLFYVDRYLRSEDSHSLKIDQIKALINADTILCYTNYICNSLGVHLILAITSNNTFIAYDPLEPNSVVIEVQLLSDTMMSGKISERVTHLSRDSGFAIKVLDDELGLCVVWHGKYWSYFSLINMINWRHRDTGNIAQEEPTAHQSVPEITTIPE